MNFVSKDNMTSLMTAIGNEIVEVQGMVAGDFDQTQAYAAGDVVIYSDKLYRFDTTHAANTPWSGSDATEVNVIDLISDVEITALTTAEVNALIALL